MILLYTALIDFCFRWNAIQRLQKKNHSEDCRKVWTLKDVLFNLNTDVSNQFQWFIILVKYQYTCKSNGYLWWMFFDYLFEDVDSHLKNLKPVNLKTASVGIQFSSFYNTLIPFVSIATIITACIVLGN